MCGVIGGLFAVTSHLMASMVLVIAVVAASCWPLWSWLAAERDAIGVEDDVVQLVQHRGDVGAGSRR